MPETKVGLVHQNPVSALGRWLDFVDELGPRMPLQPLTEKNLAHPLSQAQKNPENHFLNLQLGAIVLDVINNPLYFSPDRASQLLSALQNEEYLGNAGDQTDPRVAVNKLTEKQKGYLTKGESWQFAKVGLEVSNEAQQIGYKLHAIQELIEPFAGPGATKYEDQIADILTVEIVNRAAQYKILNQAIGPYRFSIRWQDFLEGAENPNQQRWIKQVIADYFPADKKTFEEILLTIAQAESRVTPGTLLQILERKTFRSTGKVPPLRPQEVADPHKHHNKVELYLPLMGPGTLKVKFSGENNIHTFTPDPNVVAEIDLAQLGAKMVNDIPTIIYKGQEFKSDKESRFINLPLGNDHYAQFIIVRPDDVHDYQNVGISPASAFALTLGFPKAEGESLENDFYASAF